MNEERIEELEGAASLYAFLSSVFLTLPDKEFLDSLASLDPEPTESAGYNAIVAYARDIAGQDHEEALMELARDRARLMRGENNEGMEPPYESLYVKAGTQSNIMNGSINRFFADAGFAKSSEVKDAPEQLGVEINFAATLMQHEAVALREDDAESAGYWREMRERFREQHLGRWAHAYAKAMHEHANTKFYQGVALLIEEAV